MSTVAAGWFPASPAALYLTGSYFEAFGDFETALGYFDETVGVQPRHEDGLLGRTMCLTLLKQADAAIEPGGMA